METKKRIVLDVPREFHTRIKMEAALINMSMTKWAMQALVEKIIKQESYNKQQGQT